MRNEVEALFLENELIKAHKPRFNIRLKDDKSYPFLAVTVSEEWPRAMVMRGKKRKGVRYFGPVRPRLRDPRDARPAAAHVPDPHLHQQQAPAPPAARSAVPLRAHREVRRRRASARSTTTSTMQLVNELISFLDGEHAPVLDRLEKQMHEASEALEFERAARLRDQLLSVRKVIERQQMVGAKEEDLDVIGFAEDPLEASVQVFYVRRGRVTGRKGLVVDKVEDVDPPELVARILEQLYGDAPAEDVPREVLVPIEPEQRELYEEFLSLTREKSKVRIRVPQRGSKRALLETVTLQRAGSVRSAQAEARRRTTTRERARCSRCRRRSACPRHRCASSASTSRTCRAPRSSRR